MADYDIQALEMHGVQCMDYMNLLCKLDGMILCCETCIKALEHEHILLNSVRAVSLPKMEERRTEGGTVVRVLHVSARSTQTPDTFNMHK